MLYVQLDTNWPDNHKIIEAGIEGAGLHAIVLCLAKRQETDGWVRRRLLYRQGATDVLIDSLVDLTLLEADADRVRPNGWLDRNPSQAAIAAKRAAKAESGRRGNHSKWDHGGLFDDCPICNPKPQVVAECDRTGSQALASDRSPTKSESKTEVAIATPPASYPVNAEQVAANLENIRRLREENGLPRKQETA